MKILQIDAWGNKEEGYEWNNWFHIGDISKEEFQSLPSSSAVRGWLRENGYLSNNNNDYHAVDDQYNIVIEEGETDRPILAIEYGPDYN